MARVLVIEDDELARESVTLMLEESGHEVAMADDGDVGLKMFSEEPYDLVVTDLIMPEVNGMDVLSQIKQEHPDTRVIVISGGGRLTPISYLDVAMKLGADDVLTKPFTAFELTSSAAMVLHSPAAPNPFH
ncbi:MAG: response regulator [Kordiimonas sp.]